MAHVTASHTRFTVKEFTRLFNADVFGNRRVELINGRIYRMPPQAVPHLVAISKASRAFFRIVPDSEWLIVQGTLVLDEYSAPDPDLLWLPCPIGTPIEDWPLPVLLIEVSHTTYRRDSGIKLRSYAQRGVPEYWIVNIKADRVEVYRTPTDPTGQLQDCHYASIEHFGRGQSIPVQARPGVTLAVDELLP